MAYSANGHGNGRGRPRLEVCKPRDLPAGLPAGARPEPARDDGGRLRPGPGTTELARAGGLAAAESRQIAQLSGLWDAPPEHAYAPYARLGREWRASFMAELAAEVGGGKVGAGVAALVSTAAMELAASRWLYDLGAQTGDPKAMTEAAKLADASRQNTLAAFELAARTAKCRRSSHPSDLQARLEAAFGGKK